MKTDPPDEEDELWSIFRDEVARRAEAMSQRDATLEERKRALHALKGAAGMMGLSELEGVLKALHHAALTGDRPGFARASQNLSPELQSRGIVSEGLAVGVRALFESLPPTGHFDAPRRPSDPVSEMVAWFKDEARQRLVSFDAAIEKLSTLSAESEVREEIDGALRHVHAIKGGAGALELDEVARGAHALESALAALRARGRRATETELGVMCGARDELARVIAGADAEAGVGRIVASLRAEGLLRERDVTESRRSLSPDGSRGTEVIRVATHALARLTESVGEVGLVHGRIERHAGEVQEAARALSRAGRAVGEALRRIGPARPWGVPADVLRALGAVDGALVDGVRALEREARGMRHDAEVLGVIAGDARDVIAAMGSTTAGWLFDRVVPTVAAMARTNTQVRVVREGDGVEIGRAVAERMVEPLVQLVRNAVTHGVESASQRVSRDKPARATLRLEAMTDGERLTLVVSDDGAGVDTDALRARTAVTRHFPGGMSASEADVLDALFLPGVSTRDHVDIAAGRGVGLDLVRQEVRALGGKVRVESVRGKGARFVIDLWPKGLVQRVVGLRSAGGSVALPLGQVVRVMRTRDVAEGVPARALSEVLGLRESARGEWAVLLSTRRGEVALTVEYVEGPTDIVVRSMPSPLGGVGPWSAVAVDGEGSVTLVMDPERLLPFTAPKNHG